MKINMKLRKILSVVLCVCMLLQNVPMHVHAEEGGGNAPYMTAETAVTGHTAPETDLPDNGETFALYAEQQLYGYEMSVFGTRARAGLNAVEQNIYDALKTQITSVAQNGGSTVFAVSDIEGLQTSWTNTELGVEYITDTNIESAMNSQFDLTNIVTALLSDCPFELYWYDKVAGAEEAYQISFSGYGEDQWTEASVVNLTFTFAVSSDFGSENTVSADVSKVDAARDNAAAIVEANKDKTDYEKLLAYKDAVCAAVSYNNEAAGNDYTGGYGAPWQLIYVFDGDDATNVVCEGYSKAFQYLCDLGGLDCISVSGTMTGGTGAGDHMWNVVTLNEKNYLVDVTNCDEGTVGAPDALFMVGGTYTDGGYSYTIDAQTVAYTACGDLNLSADDYSAEPTDPEVCTHTFTETSNGFCTACDAYEPAADSDADGVYEIANAGQLYWFAEKVNSGDPSVNAVLTDDIVVNEGTMTAETADARAWTPIGNNSNQYTGTFNGAGFTVSGLYFNDGSVNNVGLFGCVGDGTVQNVGVVKSYLHGNNSVGGVVGDSDGTMTGCYNTGTVSGTGNYVGGVTGDNGGTMTGCYNTGAVSGYAFVGGVVGDNGGTMTGCCNSGTVTGTDYVGGVAGRVFGGTVENCSNAGTVTGKNHVGGVTGNSDGTMTGCYNTAPSPAPAAMSAAWRARATAL